MKELFQSLNSIYPLSEGLQQYLLEKLVRKEVPRKEFILKKGRVCEDISFIEKGIVRCYHKEIIKQNEFEITEWFMSEKDVIISVESFFKQKPGNEYIQAVEDCVLYSISYADLQYAYRNFIEFNFNARVITEKYYMLSEERNSLRMKRAPEMYNFMMEYQPQIIQRVPSKYIASYLGIDEATLSRIRARKY